MKVHSTPFQAPRDPGRRPFRCLALIILGLACVALGCESSDDRDARSLQDASTDGMGAVQEPVCNPIVCPLGWNKFSGVNCGPCDLSGTCGTCHPFGDGLCYKPCTRDSDCTDPRFPVCGTIDKVSYDATWTVGACKTTQLTRICPTSHGCIRYSTPDTFNRYDVGQGYEENGLYCTCTDSGTIECGTQAPEHDGGADRG